MKCIFFVLLTLLASGSKAQETPSWQGKFEQLDQALPTPNEYRTGSGAPGPKYWQQQVDYDIDVELNDETHIVTGAERIIYSNNSPDALKYLWLQLDQNILAKDNLTDRLKTNALEESMPASLLQQNLDLYGSYEGGYKIKSVKDAGGRNLSFFINYTMMRIDLPQPLQPKEKVNLSIDWSYAVSDRLNEREAGRRGGMEYFPEDDNYLYGITHWFPRLCVYDDYLGWQNKQFLGQGEFTLDFGNYKVRITVPADHLVAATGVLQNPQQVLSADQLARFEKAKTSFDNPVIIVSQGEAKQKEKIRSPEKRTWEFQAFNVRDFAFASSRKFIWDAQAVRIGKGITLAMSFYPKEGNPLWEQESTKAVKNAITTYSKYTLDYPYPVAISVHTASGGMEYPMIAFNGGRPNRDGTYSDDKKWSMIRVVIHEVGHNFFPMIINSDERQWAWMDEGVNSFVQYRTQVENYPEMPQVRGPADKIIPYMRGDKSIQRPLMVSADNVVMGNYGPEQYAKCATALNILRETVMGPALFDKSFKEYAQRWAFKHPKPADFFRTMEDASAVDLDWFWRGWFYSTDNCDLSIDKVKWYTMRKAQTDVEYKNKKVIQGDLTADDNGPDEDFSAGPESFSVIPTDARLYQEFRNKVDDQAIISKLQYKNFYEVTFTNKGGLVMPVIIEWTFKDGSREIEQIPAEIWRVNETSVTKVFVKDKEVVSIEIDPRGETADIYTEDNIFPKLAQPSKFDQLKKKGR